MDRISPMLSAVVSRISDFRFEHAADFEKIDSNDTIRLKLLGITIHGHSVCDVYVQDTARSFGRITIQNYGAGNRFWFGGTGPRDSRINIRAFGNGADVFMPSITTRFDFDDLALASHGHTVFVGAGLEAVSARIGIHGENRFVAIGDDCMISEASLGNHDMHAIFDIATGAIVNRPPCDMVVERHVWIGFRSSVLAVERVGEGSVIGTGSLVLTDVPPFSMAVGMPARVVRDGVSWSHPVRTVDGADLAWARQRLTARREPS